ncbi:PP2C family serine/threonine-protein phosphatase [Achromobacter xylosoxidans]|uniref:PP2C family serine/threonine-protein phosphatase n=1 Tax=Alcaligenes xylosoxydans xylosoxydans TaxID=85698 RepID=UPI0034D45166
MKENYDELRNPTNSSLTDELVDELYQIDWNFPSAAKIDDALLAFGAHPGERRTRNEDRVAVAKISSINGQGYVVAIVCDGVGGLEAGDMAASTAISACVSHIAKCQYVYPIKELLPRAIRAMDDSVRKALGGRGATTACVVLISSAGDFAATSIGDSRIFSWDINQKKLDQVSVDDTLENELRKIRNADLSMLKQRGIGGSLSQALGESGRTSEDLNIIIHDRDSFSDGMVMASDGVWKVSLEAFKAVVVNSSNALDAVRRVLATSSWMGGIDNAAIITIKDIATLQDWAKDTKENRTKGGFTLWFGDTKLVRRGPFEPDNENPGRQDSPESGPNKFKNKSRKPATNKFHTITQKKQRIQLEIDVDSRPVQKKSAEAKDTTEIEDNTRPTQRNK